MTSHTPTWRTCWRCRTTDDDAQSAACFVVPVRAARTGRGGADLAGSSSACRMRAPTSLRPRGTSPFGSCNRPVVDRSAIRPPREGFAEATSGMRNAYPGDFSVDPSTLAEAIEALRQCAERCMQCADAYLSEQDTGRRTDVRLHLGCAKLCTVAARVISRQADCEVDADVVRRSLEACIAVSRRCGDECSNHGGHVALSRVCVDACRASERACRALLQAVT
jgi:hypothetical protein